MGRVEITCLALGAALVTAGLGVLLWPLSLIAAGVFLIVAGLPRGAS